MTRTCTGEQIDGPSSPLPQNSSLVDQRNLPSPDVSRRLPAELLASIFISIARDSYNGKRDKSRCSTPTAPRWVKVSYVCRYWRDVALNCPTLWSYVPATSQRWIEELLDRSQMAPLKIRLEAGPLNYSHQNLMLAQVLSIVEQVMNHSHRIHELRLDLASMFDPEAHSQVLSKLLSTRVPCLQYLKIENFSFPEGKSLSEENTPVLHTLILRYGLVPLYALGPSVLTTLALDYAPIDTMANFLAMLRHMPHLVHLYARDSLPSARDFLSNGEFHATPTISLPHLSRISIMEVPLTAVIALISCVDIPLRTHILLDWLGHDIVGFTHQNCRNDCVRLASLLAQRISKTNSPKYRSLIVGGTRDHRFTFSTSERVEYYSPADDTFLQVVLSRESPAYELQVHYLLSSICRSVPLTNIQSVHFLGSLFDTEFWRDMLASLSDVRRIIFTHGPMPNITSILSLPSPHLTRSLQGGCIDRSQGKAFVPALEKLELYQVTLVSWGRRGGRDPVDEVQELYDAIATRKETRCRLIIKDCCLKTDEGVEDLEAVGLWEGDQFKVTSNV